MGISSTQNEIENNGATPTARHIIAALKRRLEREKAMRARLAELKAAREKYILTTLLPTERAYAETLRIDFGFDAAIAELERALKEKE